MSKGSEMVRLVGALVALLLLVGCAADEPQATPTDGTDETAPDDGGASPTETGADGGGEPSGDPIVIGHWAPLSGPAAANGEFEANGVELAIDEANEAGGVLGRPVELVQYDDETVPENSVNVVRRMLDRDGVQFIVGGIISTSVLAIKDLTADRALTMVTAAKAPAVTEEGHDLLLRTHSTLITDTSFMNDFLQENPDVFPCESIYMIVEDTDYGRGDSGLYTSYWEEQGTPEIVASDTYPLGTTDFTTILTRVGQSDVDCLYVNGNIGQMTALLQQIQTLGIDLPIFAATSNVSQPMADDLGADVVDGIITGDTYVPSLPSEENAAFVELYTEAYGSPPERQAALGYASTRIVLDAIEEAGAADDPAAVAEVIRGRSWDTVFGTLTFDDQGQSDMGAIPITFESGNAAVLGE